jgi:hypothetical protein
MAVQTPAGNAIQFHSDFCKGSLAHKPQAFATTTDHSEIFRSPLLFEDIMDSSSDKLQMLSLY